MAKSGSPSRRKTQGGRAPSGRAASRVDNSARLKAVLATHYMERSYALHLKTANPIHAWRVYELARHGGLPIPHWVLSYFDRVAKALTAPAGPASPKAIADALGLGTKGGPSKAAQARTDQRDLDIVGEIVFLQDRADTAIPGDEKLDLRDDLGIMQHVADEHGLSLERVQAVYYKMIGPANPRRRRRKPPR